MKLRVVLQSSLATCDMALLIRDSKYYSLCLPRIGGITGDTVNWFGLSPLLLPCSKHFQLDLAWVKTSQWSFLRLLPNSCGMVHCHRQVRFPLVANLSRDCLADQLPNFFCLPCEKILVDDMMIGTWNTFWLVQIFLLEIKFNLI